jgi:hypothetical protein
MVSGEYRIRRKARASRGLMAAGALILLTPSFGQQVILKFNNDTQRVHDALRSVHLSGSLVYSGDCKSRRGRDPVPPVGTPRQSDSPRELLRKMFPLDSKMRVTQDPDGMIRMAETGVPTDILDVKIHHLSFDDSSGESGPWGLSLRGPNVALGAIFSTPEVQAFNKVHNAGLDHLESPGNALDSGLPIISGQLDDVTVS